MRIILFTGKGGAGKTTVAAATAIKTARSGLKTLIISTDPAHSLSDAFGYSLNPEPLELEENLYAQELDVYYSMQKYWQNIRQLMLRDCEIITWHFGLFFYTLTALKILVVVMLCLCFLPCLHAK